MLDSSKALDFLSDNYLERHARKEIDLRVIHLIRDFRGWISSVQKHRASEGKRTGYLEYSYRWLYGNRKVWARLNESGCRVLTLPYENLVFENDLQLSRLCDFFGIERPSVKLPRRQSICHELLGSPSVRNRSPGKISNKYDTTWMNDYRSLLLGPLLAPVMSYREKWFRSDDESISK